MAVTFSTNRSPSFKQRNMSKNIMAVKSKPEHVTADDFEWNVENEVQLFLAMNGHKPVGITKNFQMLCIKEKLESSVNKEFYSKTIWEHLNTLYDLQALDDCEQIPFPNSELDFDLPHSEFASLMDEKSTAPNVSRAETLSDPEPESEVKREVKRELQVYKGMKDIKKEAKETAKVEPGANRDKPNGDSDDRPTSKKITEKKVATQEKRSNNKEKDVVAGRKDSKTPATPANASKPQTVSSPKPSSAPATKTTTPASKPPATSPSKSPSKGTTTPVPRSSTTPVPKPSSAPSSKSSSTPATKPSSNSGSKTSSVVGSKSSSTPGSKSSSAPSKTPSTTPSKPPSATPSKPSAPSSKSSSAGPPPKSGAHGPKAASVPAPKSAAPSRSSTGDRPPSKHRTSSSKKDAKREKTREVADEVAPKRVAVKRTLPTRGSLTDSASTKSSSPISTPTPPPVKRRRN